ncbi:hypothetical protein A4X13_0g7960, partial [Tilletia indica]
MTTDDDEHTALYWACAMGRVRLVKLLPFTGLGHLQRSTQADRTVLQQQLRPAQVPPGLFKAALLGDQHRSVGPHRFPPRHRPCSQPRQGACLAILPRDGVQIDSPSTPHNPKTLEKRSREQVEAEWKEDNSDGRPSSDVKKARHALEIDPSKGQADFEAHIAG